MTAIQAKLPYRYDYEIYQGTDWSRFLIVTDSNDDIIDLTSYSAVMRINESAEEAPLYELSSSGISPAIIIDAADGQITWTLTNTQTQAMTAQKYVYDLMITDADGLVSCWLYGTIFVTPRMKGA